MTSPQIKTEPVSHNGNNQICRLCMSEESLDDVFKDDQLKEWIWEFLAIKISGDDRMSQVICTICRVRLTEFHQFRMGCHEVQEVLQALIPDGTDEAQSVTTVTQSVTDPKATNQLQQIHNVGGSLIRCEVCRMVFQDEKQLTNHKRIHETGHFKCYMCEKSFATRVYLNNHIQTHTTIGSENMRDIQVKNEIADNIEIQVPTTKSTSTTEQEVSTCWIQSESDYVDSEPKEDVICIDSCDEATSSSDCQDEGMEDDPLGLEDCVIVETTRANAKVIVKPQNRVVSRPLGKDKPSRRKNVKGSSDSEESDSDSEKSHSDSNESNSHAAESNSNSELSDSDSEQSDSDSLDSSDSGSSLSSTYFTDEVDQCGTSDNSDEGYKCSECDRTFNRECRLKAHMAIHEENESDESSHESSGEYEVPDKSGSATASDEDQVEEMDSEKANDEVETNTDQEHQCNESSGENETADKSARAIDSDKDLAGEKDSEKVYTPANDENETNEDQQLQCDESSGANETPDKSDRAIASHEDQEGEKDSGKANVENETEDQEHQHDTSTREHETPDKPDSATASDKNQEGEKDIEKVYRRVLRPKVPSNSSKLTSHNNSTKLISHKKSNSTKLTSRKECHRRKLTKKRAPDKVNKANTKKKDSEQTDTPPADVENETNKDREHQCNESCGENETSDKSASDEDQEVEKDSEKVYQCDLCQKVYSNSTKLTSHKKYHRKKLMKQTAPGEVTEANTAANVENETDKDQVLQCDVCQKICPTKKTLRVHKRIVHGPRNHRCDICDVQYTLRTEMTRHVFTKKHMNKVREKQKLEMEESSKKARTKQGRNKSKKKTKVSNVLKDEVFEKYQPFHPNKKHDPSKPGKCHVCDRMFPNRWDLANHMKYHRPKKYICDVCEKPCHSKAVLRKHVVTHVSIVERQKARPPRDLAKVPRPHKCDICKTAYMDKTALWQHNKTVHGPRNFECDICGFKFPANDMLMKHLQLHATRGHTKEDFRALKKLVQKNDESTKQKNDQLHSSVPSENETNENEKAHKGPAADKAFQCNVCQKAFETTVLLYRHNRLEHRPKRYKCSVCSKRYAFRKQLNMHMKIHQLNSSESTVAKDFECPECHKIYASWRSLYQHVREHHVRNKTLSEDRTFACAKCDKKFQTAPRLGMHMRTVHAPVEHKCDSCNITFPIRVKLWEHMTKQHAKKSPSPDSEDTTDESDSEDAVQSSNTTKRKQPQRSAKVKGAKLRRT